MYFFISFIKEFSYVFKSKISLTFLSLIYKSNISLQACSSGRLISIISPKRPLLLIAGSMAFKSAMRKASPVILEPIMKVSVTVPDEYLGDIMGDLSSRRGAIQGMEQMPGAQRINAMVPLSEMFGYATDMRSRTQGRGQYSMEPSHYAEVPKSISEKIVSSRSKKSE